MKATLKLSLLIFLLNLFSREAFSQYERVTVRQEHVPYSVGFATRATPRSHLSQMSYVFTSQQSLEVSEIAAQLSTQLQKLKASPVEISASLKKLITARLLLKIVEGAEENEYGHDNISQALGVNLDHLSNEIQAILMDSGPRSAVIVREIQRLIIASYKEFITKPDSSCAGSF